jgi:hypothetical protein
MELAEASTVGVVVAPRPESCSPPLLLGILPSIYITKYYSLLTPKPYTRTHLFPSAVHSTADGLCHPIFLALFL